MIQFILVIILNSVPQSIQVFNTREQCFLIEDVIQQTENVESYCVPMSIKTVTRQTNEIIG